eukprot:560144-Amphidinium_carterae.1
MPSAETEMVRTDFPELSHVARAGRNVEPARGKGSNVIAMTRLHPSSLFADGSLANVETADLHP